MTAPFQTNLKLGPQDRVPSTQVPKISFVSLGCPKALVDSERIITQLRAEGYELTRIHGGADAVIVNTCGFLDSAKAESLAAIEAAMAENGKVIVTGCMGAEAGSLYEAFPALHAITGPQDYESVMHAVHGAAPAPHDPYLDLVPDQGIRLTPRHYAYLKISEGCNNRCSFCIIPRLRGDLVSRPAGDVLREAEKLSGAGVKELLVIAQDTGAYGLDLRYAESQYQDRAVRAKFIDLMRELSGFGLWLRLHYVYPYPHIDEVIGLMADGRILPYLDVPFQHASPRVLKAMRRPGDQDKTLDRIHAWRTICPEITLRSTFIVGFPGETDEDFQILLDWMSEAKLDRVGAFKYEPVRGAAANDLGLPMVAPEVQEIRYRRFMEHAQAISARKLKDKVGKRLQVIVDEAGPRSALQSGASFTRKTAHTFAHDAVGRTKGDAPEIDGKVHMTSHRPLRPGEIVNVKIERADAYDLFGAAVHV